MPNQRRKGKKLVTFWLMPKERKQLREKARNSGLSVSDFIVLKCKIQRED